VLTITANSIARQYGRANPAFAFLQRILVKWRYAIGAVGDIVLRKPRHIGQRDRRLPDYVLRVDFRRNCTSFKLDPVVLTITPRSDRYCRQRRSGSTGAPNPIFTGTITGIQNADNITATHATAATPTSPVGMYAIVPTLVDPGGKLGNYFVTMNKGLCDCDQASTTTALSAAPIPQTLGK